MIPCRLLAHIKRVLFMGSLYFAITGNTRPDDQALEEAHRRLKLVPTKNGLKMSAALCEPIWKARLSPRVVSEVKVAGCDDDLSADCCKLIASCTPAWLLYGQDGSVPLDDIRKVVQSALSLGSPAMV